MKSNSSDLSILCILSYLSDISPNALSIITFWSVCLSVCISVWIMSDWMYADLCIKSAISQFVSFSTKRSTSLHMSPYVTFWMHIGVWWRRFEPFHTNDTRSHSYEGWVCFICHCGMTNEYLWPTFQLGPCPSDAAPLRSQRTCNLLAEPLQ